MYLAARLHGSSCFFSNDNISTHRSLRESLLLSFNVDIDVDDSFVALEDSRCCFCFRRLRRLISLKRASLSVADTALAAGGSKASNINDKFHSRHIGK